MAMSDRQFDELLKETLDEYGAPPATPKDDIWRAVAAERRKVVLLPWWRRPITRVDVLVAAAAAVLLVAGGIWVGRSTLPGPGARIAPESAVLTESPGVVDGAVELGMSTGANDPDREVLMLAANRYLSRTESFLTRYRAGDPALMDDEKTREWARRSLTDVRLLIDSPAGEDPELKALLLELEIVLARVLQASGDESSDNRERIQERLSDQSLLPRLRSLIPVGPDAAASQGVAQ
jgi:hypothetical protein